MMLDIDMIKKACMLNNKILSARKGKESSTVYIQYEEERIEVIYGELSLHPFEEAGCFKALINMFAAKGELCFDKKQTCKNGDLIIHLKSVD